MVDKDTLSVPCRPLVSRVVSFHEYSDGLRRVFRYITIDYKWTIRTIMEYNKYPSFRPNVSYLLTYILYSKDEGVDVDGRTE